MYEGHSLVLSTAGELMVWGWNSFGQLGIGEVSVKNPIPQHNVWLQKQHVRQVRSGTVLGRAAPDWWRGTLGFIRCDVSDGLCCRGSMMCSNTQVDARLGRVVQCCGSGVVEGESSNRVSVHWWWSSCAPPVLLLLRN